VIETVKVREDIIVREAGGKIEEKIKTEVEVKIKKKINLLAGAIGRKEMTKVLRMRVAQNRENKLQMFPPLTLMIRKLQLAIKRPMI
jgi:CO dehydrogenase/acetyl-CoA synthase beta subunit